MIASTSKYPVLGPRFRYAAERFNLWADESDHEIVNAVPH
jgi:hypothetical protein